MKIATKPVMVRTSALTEKGTDWGSKLPPAAMIEVCCDSTPSMLAIDEASDGGLSPPKGQPERRKANDKLNKSDIGFMVNSLILYIVIEV